MGVRGWPWWRLLIKITPMLNVHRTENQLKTQTVSSKNVIKCKEVCNRTLLQTSLIKGAFIQSRLSLGS